MNRTKVLLISILIFFSTNSKAERCGLCYFIKPVDQHKLQYQIKNYEVIKVNSVGEQAKKEIFNRCVARLKEEKIKNPLITKLTASIVGRYLNYEKYNAGNTYIGLISIHELTKHAADMTPDSNLSCDIVAQSEYSNEMYQSHNKKSRKEHSSEQDQQHGYPTTAPATTSPNLYPGTN